MTTHRAGCTAGDFGPCDCGQTKHATGAQPAEDWRDDPSADERWNAGLDFGMVRFCEALGVDPKAVNWDAATETVDGDVSAVIGNILRAKFGEDFDPDAVQRSSVGNVALVLREARRFVGNDPTRLNPSAMLARINEALSLLNEPQPASTLRQAEDALKGWLSYAEENLSEFDVDGESCTGDKLCPSCENSGCIQYKIEETRIALAALALPRPHRKPEGE